LLARYFIMPLCALLMFRWHLGQWWPRLPRSDLRAMAWLGITDCP